MFLSFLFYYQFYMTPATYLQTIVASIQALGFFPSLIVLTVNLILWRIEPIAGLIATLLTLGYLLHWI